MKWGNLIAICGISLFTGSPRVAAWEPVQAVSAEAQASPRLIQFLWDSEPGARYTLQIESASRWVDVETIESTGYLSALTREGSVGSHGVWRLVRVSDCDDPVLQPFELLGLEKVDAEGELVPSGEPGYWRVTWESQPGGRYRIQRSTDLTGWIDVSTIQATGTTSSGTDPRLVVDGERALFWRVIQILDDGSDILPPTLSFIQAVRRDDGGAPMLELSVLATDDVGVTGVDFTEAAELLGAATSDGAGGWILMTPFDPLNTPPRTFRASARDAAGNTALSELFTLSPALSLPAGIVPLGTDGKPVNLGGIVGQMPAGALTPFAYSPGDTSGAPTPGGLRIDFPDGAEIVEQGGQFLIGFNKLVFGFGDASPLQVDVTNPDPETPFGGRSITIQLPSGSTGLLPLGPLDVATLIQLAGLDPADGIPVRLFNCFSLDLVAGVVSDYAIEGALWGLEKLGLPLPEFSGDWAAGVFDLAVGGKARFPLYGSFELPELAGGAATLLISRSSPLVLTLCPDGEFSLRGPAVLEFPNGVRFAVSVILDDPNYELSITAQGLNVPLADSLADALPDHPADCIPSGIDDTGLDAAELCLDRFRVAYLRFTQSALALRPGDAPDLGIQAAPETFDAISAVARAWASSALIPFATSLPLQEVRDLVSQLGRSGVGSRDFKSTLEHVAELLAHRGALDNYETNGGSGDISGARADLDDTLEVAVAAAIARSKDPDAITSLDCMRVALDLLTGIWDKRSLLPPGSDVEFQSASIDLIGRLNTKVTAGLGIEAGEFDHTANPTIANMNRFTALEHVQGLVGIVGAGAVFGADLDSFPGFDETLQQIFGRAFASVDQNIIQGLLEENVPAALLAIAELTDLVGEWAAIGGEDGIFPGVAEIAGYVGELEPIVVRESMLPRDETSFFNVAVRVRALLAVLEELPPDTAGLFPIVALAHGDLGDSLGEAVLLASTGTSFADLSDLLAAGALYVRIGNRYDALANSADWESTHLPAVVDRLGQLAESGLEWALLNRLVATLVGEGNALEADAARALAESPPDEPTAAARQASRKLYFQHAAAVLDRQRRVATALWAETDALRAADPESFSADAFLPGDLKVDKISGSLRYNRSTSEISGAFAGELRLPRLDSSLTIQDASIRSSGEFEMNAFGQVVLPAGNPAATMSVPQKDPFHLQWSRRSGMAISGTARFEFSNGVFFQAGIDFEDPLYAAEVEAGGLHVDFAESLAAALPGDVDADDIRDGTIARLWADYYRLLSGCIETGFRSDADVDDPPLGSLPVFAGNLASDVHCLIDAWSCLVLAEAGNGRHADYQETFAEISALMAWLDASFAEGLAGFESIFGPSTEFETAYQLARLEKLSLTYSKVAMALGAVADAQLAGGSELPDTATMASYLDRAAALWQSVRMALLDNLTFLQDPELSDVLAKAGLDLIGAYQVLGEGAAAIQVADVVGFLESAGSAFALSIGFDPTTGQLDHGVIGSMDYDAAVAALRAYLEVESNLQLVGGTSILNTTFITALLDRRRDLALANLGFVTGSGQFFPETAADLVVQTGIARLADLADDYPATTGSNMTLPTGFGTQVPPLFERFTQRLRATPNVQWKARKSLLMSLLQLDFLSQLDGGGPVLDPEFDDHLLATMHQMVAEARGRMRDDEVALLRAVTGSLGEPTIASLYADRLLIALGGIGEWLDSPWSAGLIPLGDVLARELLVIEELRRASPAIPIPAQQETAVLLQLLDDRMIAICSAEKRANPLAKLAADYLEAAATDADIPFSTTLEDEGQRLLNSSRLIAGGYAQQIAGTGEDDRPSDLHLPDGMFVRRVFGSVFYNRADGFLKGTFGGRLEFPNENAFFQITQATLDSDGAYSIAAVTEFPLEPADNANLQITASINLAGSPAGLDSLTGDGELALRLNDDPGTGTQTFGVGVTYGGGDPDRPLTFTAALDGLQNLDAIRFSDDFVLFGGSVRAVIPLAKPGEFDLLIDGKAGLFARESTLAPPVEQGDFWAYVDIGGLGLSYAGDSVVARFEGGTLTLHEETFALLVEQVPGGILVPADPAAPISIPMPSGFSIGYDFADGKPLFTSGDPDAITAIDIPLPSLGFNIPGLEGAGLTLRTCDLQFFGDKFPILKELDGSLRFPMPGRESTNAGTSQVIDLTIEGSGWGIDGFPPDNAAVTLNQAVTVLDADAFKLELLGADDVRNPPGCALAIRFMHDDTTGTTRFVLAGGMTGTFDGEILWDGGKGEAVSVTGCGSFGWTLGELPDIDLDTLAVGGNFKLGGEDGITVKGTQTTPGDQARIVLTDLQNLFVRSLTQPFKITLEGALDIANFVEFGLEETAFIWDGTTDGTTPSPSNLLARFEPGGFYGALGEEAIELADGLLPLYPTLIGLRFRESGYPLIPQGNETGLFDPSNVIALLSGVVSLPNGASIASGSPGIFGELDLLRVGLIFDSQLGSYVPDLAALQLDGFTLGVENLDLPFMGGLTGGLTIYNFDDPPNLYVAGILGGESKGTGVNVLLAARPTEIMGACFELEISGTGIPLDSYSLGGILLTGGKGGINFLNGFGDPCDFKQYVALGNSQAQPFPTNQDPMKNPPGVMTMAEDPVNGRTYPTLPDPADGLSCIDPKSFPPATINPLCFRHPITDKIIFKGTNLSKTDAEGLLASLLATLAITRADLASVNQDDIIDRFMDTFTEKVEATRAAAFDFVDNPPPLPNGDPAPPPPERAREYFATLLQEVIDTFDESARAFLRETIRSFLDGKLNLDGCHAIATANGDVFPANPDLYDILLCTLQQGAPCLDVTLKLGGSISYTGLSTVASISGAATLSTTGTGVIEGSVNLIGIPVANTTLALSVTDSTGQINPAFGGFAEVALGPLEFGSMSTALACDGCLEKTVAAFGTFLADTYGTVSEFAAEQDFLLGLMDAAVPALDVSGNPVPRPRNVPIGQYWLGVTGDPNLDLDTDAEKLAFLGSVLNSFELVVNGDPLPVTVTPEVLGAFIDNFKYFIANLIAAVDPNFCFTGQVGPKLFGFPLTGGADTFVGGSMTYGTVLDGEQRFQELTAETVFSPTTLMLFPVMGTYSFMVPAFDEASMGYSLRTPAFNADPIPGTDPPVSTIELAIEEPVTFVAHQTQTLIEDAVLSFSYEVKPMGITLGNGQGRMIMPRLANHPARPGVNWSLPYDPDGPELIDRSKPGPTPEIATRMEVILAALSKGRLKDPRWRGMQGELVELFDDGVPANTDPESGYEPTEEDGQTCAELLSEITGRMRDANPGDPFGAMAQLDLPRDYFPYGGLIFGGEVSLPRFITDLPPPEMATVLTPPTAENAFEWISATQTVFSDYLTATTCVGQMAGYLPAPSPIFPADINWGNATPTDFIAAIREFDYGKFLTGEIAADVFPDEQILLSGWLDAPVLNMPTLRGAMLYDRNTQEFTIDGEIPTDSWLHGYVDGNLHFEILPPREAFAVGNFVDYMPPIPPGATEEEIAALRKQAEADYKDAFEAQPSLTEQLQGFLDTLPDEAGVAAVADELVHDALTTISNALPRVSATASTAINFPPPLPAELEGIVELSGSAELFAFSPGFDPGYQPSRSDPFAVAQRKGGIGFAGAMALNLALPGTTDHVLINIPDASFALLPPTNPLLLPATAANLNVADISIPIPFSDPLVMPSGQFVFNTDAEVGTPILKLTGEISPFSFAGFGIANLSGNPTAPVPGDLVVINQGIGNIGVDFEVGPARFDMPGIFGTGAEVSVHAAGDDSKPFVISSAGEVTAEVTVNGDLPLIDPISTLPVGIVHFPTEDPGTPERESLSASLLADNSILTSTFVIPVGTAVTLPPLGIMQYPLPAAGTLVLSSDGTFELDLTIEPLSFPPAMRVEAAVPGTRQPLNVTLGSNGIALTSGARLAIDVNGESLGLLSLDTLVVKPDGDFAVLVSTPTFALPGFISVGEDPANPYFPGDPNDPNDPNRNGSYFELRRAAEPGGDPNNPATKVTSLRMVAPKVVLFPGSTTGVPPQDLPSPIQELVMDSTGRFYANSGVQNLDLFGSVTAVGTLEIGYNPGAPLNPDFSVSPGLLAFGSRMIGEPATEGFTVTNTGETQLVLAIEFLSGAGSGDYCVSRSGLTLAPGESEDVDVVFLAQQAGATNGTLRVRDVDSDAASQTIQLTATGLDHTGVAVNVGAPVLGFGQVALGSGNGNSFAVTNTGTGSLSLDKLTIPKGYRTSSPKTRLAPGETEIIILEFLPGLTSQGSGKVSLDTGAGLRNIDVAGTAVDRVFLQQREGSGEMVDFFMDDNGRGFAIDGNGSLWETHTNGWGWTPVDLPGDDISGEGAVLSAGVFYKVDGWLVGPGGRVFRFWEPDDVWREITNDALDDPTRNWHGASKFDSLRTIFVGEENGVGLIVRQLHTGTDPEFYQLEHLEGPPLADVAFDIESGNGVAVGQQGGIRISSNSGDTWDKAFLPAGASDDLLCVDVGSGGKAMAGAAGGRLFYSTNYGQNWAPATVSSQGVKVGDIHDVTIDVSGISYAVSDGGVVLTSSDRGATWTIDAFGFTGSDLYAVERVGGVGTWVAGARGEVHFRPDLSLDAPPVSFAPEALEFGTVGIGATKERPVTLTNRGLDPITLSITVIGAEFATTTNQIADLPPGGSASLRVIYSPGSAGSDSGRIEIGAAGFADPQIIPCRGTASVALWSGMPRFTNRDVADMQFLSSFVGYAIDQRELWKTVDGGLTWELQRTATPVDLRALSFYDTQRGWIGRVNKGSDARILRTTDGGATFTGQLTGSGGPCTDVFAVFTSEAWASLGAYIDKGLPVPGELAHTTDGGQTWNRFAGPPGDPGFNPTAIHRAAPTRIFVADGAKLWRFNPSTMTWTEVFDRNLATVRDIEFNGTNSGWTVGNGGWRTTNGGPSETDWTFMTITTLPMYAADFTSTLNGWAVAYDNNYLRIFRSADGGASWLKEVEEELESGSPRTLKAISATSSTRAWAAGGAGTYYRYGPPLPVPGGALEVAANTDLGFVEEGTPQSATLVLRNVGDDPLTIEDAFFDVQRGEDVYTLETALPITLGSGATTTASVRFSTLLPGRHDSILRFVTDGVGVVRSTGLSGTVLSPPHVIAVTTNPPGIGIKVDGQSTGTPTTLIVRSGDTQAGEFSVGESISIDVPSDITLAGVPYVFVGWNGAAGAESRVFDFVAPAHSASLVASYAPAFLIVDGVPEPGAIPGDSEPDDAPVGPWLRLSGAQLRAPELGGFALQGSMYFSADRIACTLAAKNIRVPADTQAANILSVGANSWSLDWQTGGEFKFHGETPSVQVFNCQVAPPSSVDVVFGSGGRHDLAIELVEAFEEANGLFRVSQGSEISLGYDPNELGLAFGLEGNLKALRLPGGDGWGSDADVSIDQQFSGADLFPIVIAGDQLDLDLGVVLQIDGDAGSLLRLDRTPTGDFRFDLVDVDLNFGPPGASGTPMANGVTVSGGTDGKFGFAVNRTHIGPFILTPKNNSDVEIEWDLRRGDVDVDVPQSTLSADGVSGWEDDITFPAISFDSSGDFYKKITMPGISFDGININSGGPIEKNYIRLKRENGVTSFRIRDRRSFFGDLQVLRFDIDSDGDVEGKFYGNMTYNGVEYGEISMDYSPGATNYQFVGEFRALDNDFTCIRFKFGSGGSYAGACLFD